jgi:CHASE3 domain sensor protein
LNGNGNGPKKAGRKSAGFRDEEELESEEENGVMTMTQKQELAEKIQLADENTLAKAVQIIQQTTNVGAVSYESFQLQIQRLIRCACRTAKRLNWISTLYPHTLSSSYTT